MASTILYPPVIESKMPTFVIDPDRNITSTRVYFSISDYNSLSNFARIPVNDGVITAQKTSYDINITNDTSTATIYEEKVTNPYDIYDTMEEKLYHLWLDKHVEQKWRRFYCAIPSYVYKEHPETFERQFSGATLGPMTFNPAITYSDIGVTSNWQASMDMVLIVNHVPTDTQAFYLPEEYYGGDPNKFNYLLNSTYIDGGYIYPDIVQMKKYYESLNILTQVAVTPTTNYYTDKSKLSTFRIDPKAYPVIDGYVYPWTMVTCKDQAGINKFKPIEFENDNVSIDSGIHFYTMQRDEELYQAGETNCYFIEIQANDILDNNEKGTGDSSFVIDKYYKIQIRFMDKNIDYKNDYPYESTYWMDSHIRYFSEWSSVCLLKRIAQPILTLTDATLKLNPQGTQINLAGLVIHKHFLTVEGAITFEQSTNTTIEYLDSMRFMLYTTDDTTVIEDSGWIKYAAAALNGEYNFSYTFKKLYEKKQQYHLYIYYKTNNDFVDNYITFSAEIDTEYITTENGILTVKYPYAVISMAVDNILNANIELDTVANHESGEVMLRIWNTDSNFNGMIIVRRTSSLTNFEEWDTIMTFNNISSVNTVYWIDRTAIAGEWYKYAVIYTNEFEYTYEDVTGETHTTTKYVETDMIYNKEPVTLFLDDSFLIGDYHQLKIKFDPSINNFKRKITESSIETLGSKYPFFNRNAVIDYKTFPFSGTIATWMDDEENFAQKREIFAAKALPLHMNFVTENNYEAHYDWVLEKKFRDKVTDFLMSNKPKLFKSLTEGNILVKVHDVSFTPNQTLSRMIWSFSGTLTEIGEATVDNIVKYNIQDNNANLTFNNTTLVYDPPFDEDEDLEVLPNGFYIMQDEDIKKYTAALIGEEDMYKYHIRLTSSSAHNKALNKIVDQIDTWGPLQEDN